MINKENKYDEYIADINIKHNIQKNISPSILKIAKYWFENHTPDLDDMYLNFDWIDAMKVCWNCGKETKYIQRCHIIPKALGGSNIDPSNFVLLCDTCHREAPNINNSNCMWDWIKSNKLPISIQGTYRFQKGLIEFENKYKINIITIIIELCDGNYSKENVEKLLAKYTNMCSQHLTTITSSTYFYIAELMFKDYNKKTKKI